jgi:predicted RecA/RadA family phage recombinase
MAFKAKFSHGKPVMIDYTPNADVAAGDVIVTSNNVRVAHCDIASGKLGALADGGGIYDFAKATTSGSGWSDGVLIYWDASAKVATTTASSNKKIGIAVGAAADADTTGRVQHITQAV